MAELPNSVRALYPFESKYLELPDGNRTHFVDEGGGEPIIFAHGQPTWSFLYRSFISHFRDTHRAVAMDHIGFGLSTKPTDGGYYSLQQHVANYGALMDHLGLQNATLVLHDWGGPISMGWAVDHLERVKRLVVLDTPLSVSDPKLPIPWIFKVMVGRGLGDLIVGRLNFFVRVLLERAGTLRKLSAAEKLAYRWPLRAAADRAGVIAFPRMLAATPSDPSGPIMQRIENMVQELEIPVTFIWADRDRFIPLKMGRLTHALFKNAEGPQVVHAGHFLQEDAPDEIISIIDDFLERHP